MEDLCELTFALGNPRKSRCTGNGVNTAKRQNREEPKKREKPIKTETTRKPGQGENHKGETRRNAKKPSTEGKTGRGPVRRSGQRTQPLHMRDYTCTQGSTRVVLAVPRANLKDGRELEGTSRSATPLKA